MSEQLIVETEANLDYTMTETRNVHRSLTFSLGEKNFGRIECAI